MDQALLKETEQHMEKTLEALKREFQAVRTGRANSNLLNRVVVDYYGTPTPLQQLASVSVPDARMLLVQPWDKSIVAAVEKAILKADLGLNPVSDGGVIRLPVPQLTEERRKDLVKVIKKEAEEKRIIIRNLRRDANEKLKHLEKEAHVTEDETKRGLDEIQKLTDHFIREIDQILEQKEKEIMEV